MARPSANECGPEPPENDAQYHDHGQRHHQDHDAELEGVLEALLESSAHSESQAITD